MATVALNGRAVGAPALLVVGNAKASGVGSRPDALDGAVEELRAAGAWVEPHLTESLGELGALIELAEGRRLVVLGGDGSLHALANMPQPPDEVAVLPAGGANNIAASLGIPLDLKAAARLAVEGRPKALDGIDAFSPAGRYTALEGASVGFLAQARGRYRSDNSADLREGVRAALAELRRFRPVTLAAAIDGETEHLTVDQLFVANTPRYGFGLRVAPAADPSDGLLDLVAIRTRTRAGLVAALGRLRRGTLEPESRRAERVVLVTPPGSPVVADSTSLGAGLVVLTARPAALRLVVP
jgi:diacylglycerol kinase (ATP)